MSADAKTSRRSSGFKMADAKALTRALAKGMCTARQHGVRGTAGRAGLDTMCRFDRAVVHVFAPVRRGERACLGCQGGLRSGYKICFQQL